jgi:hypothetical protein
VAGDDQVADHKERGSVRVEAGLRQERQRHPHHRGPTS